MNAPPQLAALQQWLLSAIADPASPTASEAGAAVLPGPQQSAAERLAVYQHAYVARLLEVLREQFPCTRFAAGDDAFDRLAIGYLAAHPPSSYTLGQLGSRFPEYLDATRPADWGAFLVELARLELAIDRVFDGPGPEGLPAFVPPAGITGQWRLTLAPGLELHTFSYPASSYFTDWKAGEACDWPEPQRQHVALYRRDFIVRRMNLLPTQHAILGALAGGARLDEAIAAADSPELDESLLFRWFAAWASGGLVAIAQPPA